MLANPSLAENHRSASLPFDQQSYECHDWRHEKKCEGRQHDIKNTLQRGKGGVLHKLKPRVQRPGAAQQVRWHFLPVGLEKRVHGVDGQFLKMHRNK